MYHTWFFQKRLAEALDAKLKGYTLLECFSQNKDELILGFSRGKEEAYLIADMASDAGLIAIKESYARARKNSVDLFKELINGKVTSILCYHMERSFKITLSNGFGIIFKMHGQRSNILITRSDSVKKVFRNKLPADLSIVPSELRNTHDSSKPNILRLLGKRNAYLIDNEEDRLSQFIGRINQNSINIGLIDDNPVLKLVDLDNPVLVTDDPIEASNKLVELYQRFQIFGKEKQSVGNQLNREIAQTENYIAKSKDKLNELKTKRDPQELANLIMANLHQLKKGDEIVELQDFYNDEPIELKLNPLLSPQANAENYYRKAKNRNIEFEKIEENIQRKKEVIKEKSQLLEEINSAENLKQLRSLLTSNQRVQKEEKAVLPYSVYEIESYQVLVGKNAKSNDFLTMKVASKNDLWLHARDVSGSHVVIKEKPGNNFPNSVIEKAAQLAAFYSKRRTDSLCPVIYTPRKFVRKIKGALAGQVVVDKEQVVMVVPTEYK